MIKNYQELSVVREQIQRLVSALASLKRETGPTGERQFHILAEGCVDQIAELQGDVDDYLKVAEYRELQGVGAAAAPRGAAS